MATAWTRSSAGCGSRSTTTARSILRFETIGGKTRLVDSLGALPLQFQRPLASADGGATLSMLSPAGALFDRDDVELKVVCGESTNVTLTTTAATKLNRCDHGRIRFAMTVQVGAGAHFRYLPYELIPLRGAVYDQTIRLALADDASATLLEVVGPGLEQEPFTYTHLRLTTEIRDAGGVLALEHATLDASARCALNGATHYGSVFASRPDCGQAATDRAHAVLSLTGGGVRGSASLLPRRGAVLKALGRSSFSVRAALLRGVDALAPIGLPDALCFPGP